MAWRRRWRRGTLPRMGATARPPAATDAWPGLLDDVSHDIAVSVERTVRLMRTLPSYVDLPSDALRAVVRRNHDAIIAGLRTRRPPGPDEARRVFGDLGEVRARQSVAVSDMLAAWRIGQESLYLLAGELAAPGPGRDALLREFLELEIRWVDHAMLAAADGHRRAELGFAREQRHLQANLIRRAIHGTAATSEIRSALAPAGPAAAGPLHAIRARPGATAGAEDIDGYLGVDVPAARGNGIAALIDGDVWGLLFERPRGPAPVPVGLCSVDAGGDLARAFHLASRALDTALGLGVNGVFDFADLGVHAAVVSDPELGDALVARYLAPFDGDAGAAQVLQTVERYLANDAGTETTARELGVHVNTVRQRLARFETATGASLRATETTVEVWWALQRRRIAGR
jgi:hypothetical protein